MEKQTRKFDFDIQSAGQFFILLVFILILARSTKEASVEEIRQQFSASKTQAEVEKDQKVKDLETRNLLLELEAEAKRKELEILENFVQQAAEKKKIEEKKNYVVIQKGAAQKMSLKNSLAGGDGNAGDKR